MFSASAHFLLQPHPSAHTQHIIWQYTSLFIVNFSFNLLLNLHNFYDTCFAFFRPTFPDNFERKKTDTFFLFGTQKGPPNNVREISIVQMLHSTTSEQNIHIKTSKALHGDDMK